MHQFLRAFGLMFIFMLKIHSRKLEKQYLQSFKLFRHSKPWVNLPKKTGKPSPLVDLVGTNFSRGSGLHHGSVADGEATTHLTFDVGDMSCYFSTHFIFGYSLKNGLKMTAKDG